MDGHKFIFGLNFGEPVFQHAIYLQQDLNGGRAWESWEGEDYFDPTILLQNFEIHIGNNEDYTQNPKCAGGPFMRIDDVESYFYDQQAANLGYGNGPGTGFVWKYGLEQFCNMEGQFMHIVADLSHFD